MPPCGFWAKLPPKGMPYSHPHKHSFILNLVILHHQHCFSNRIYCVFGAIWPILCWCTVKPIKLNWPSYIRWFCVCWCITSSRHLSFSVHIGIYDHKLLVPSLWGNFIGCNDRTRQRPVSDLTINPVMFFYMISLDILQTMFPLILAVSTIFCVKLY